MCWRGESDCNRASPFANLSPLAGRGRLASRSEAGRPGEGAPKMRRAKTNRTTRSRGLRRHSTNAELRLWNRLRSRSLYGHKFVRQEPIGPYTVDFICRELRLVIEVDGGQHADNKDDVVRDQWFASRSYRVLRFWNNDVIANIDGVLTMIAQALREATPPHPTRLRSASTGRSLPASGER